MEGQADDLVAKGVPAAALTGNRMKEGHLLQDCAAGKYRVVFVSPELALQRDFQITVLASPAFRKHIIQLVIDEAHAISEWGTDDFRPEYRQLGKLRGLLPKGTPIVCTSATLPDEILQDICTTMNLPRDCARILYSNAKPNIALSVRAMQHPDGSYADLISLIPRDAKDPNDIPMTLVYAGSRLEVEDMQDFLRRHLPDSIPPTAVEFYHRYVSDEQKERILARLRSGEIRICACTDVLSWGIDLRNITRVYLWKKPRSFNALVQKYGRCVRNLAELGECVLYITKAMYKLYEKGLAPSDAADAQVQNDGEPALAQGAHLVDVNEGVRIEVGDDIDVPAPKAYAKGKRKRGHGERDEQHLIEYIGTKGCRRAVWDKFYDNQHKRQLGARMQGLEGARCCDNCTPDLFPIDVIALHDARQLQKGRRQRVPDDLADAIKTQLEAARTRWLANAYPGNHFMVPAHLLPDDILTTIVGSANSFDTLDDFNRRIRWHWSPKFGPEVVDIILAEREKYRALHEPLIPAAVSSTGPVATATSGEAAEPRPKRHRGTRETLAAYKPLQDFFTDFRVHIDQYEFPAGHRIAKHFRALPRRDYTGACSLLRGRR
ncbi:P-loop containing nucleoside triphosphate hydrolase protein [Schizophyllum commune]